MLLMRRLTATNFLTAATILAGAASSVAAAIGQPRLQGIALGAALVLASLLVRFAARDANRAAMRQARLLNTVSPQLDKIVRQLASEKRRFNKRIETLDKRIQRENSRMTLRLLGDINAARLEQIDATQQTAARDD